MPGWQPTVSVTASKKAASTDSDDEIWRPFGDRDRAEGFLVRGTREPLRTALDAAAFDQSIFFHS